VQQEHRLQKKNTLGISNGIRARKRRRMVVTRSKSKENGGKGRERGKTVHGIRKCRKARRGAGSVGGSDRTQ